MSSYIWELPNHGNTLFEQAIYESNLPQFATRRFTQQGIGKYANIEPQLTQLRPNVQIQVKPDANNNEPGRVRFNTQDPATKQLLDQLEQNGDVEGIPANANNGNNIVFNLKQDNPQIRHLIQQKLSDLGLKENVDFRFQNPQAQGGPTTLIIAKPKDDAIIDKFKQACGALVDDTRPADAQSQEEDKQREKLIASIISQYPEKIKTDVALAVYFLSQGKWFDGSDPTEERQNKIIDTFRNVIVTRDANQVKMAIQHIVEMITDGKIKVDPNNNGLYTVPNIEKQVTGNIQMPAMFESEPDDSMWNEIVITDFGIPMINLSHPAVKKVIAAENPKEECPGELKQFESKVYANERLKKVFGSGNFERILDSAFNLLTLGVAAATTDAGKRASQIIKELKEKGGMSTHRNLLLVKYEDIVDADPDNSDLTIKAKAYNRSNKRFVGEVDVPIQTLSHFYSVVDPIRSSKIYIEMYNSDDIGDYAFNRNLTKTNPMLDSVMADDGSPLFEYVAEHKTPDTQKPLYEYILATALAAGAIAAAPQIGQLIQGWRGSKKSNNVSNAAENNGTDFAKLKKEYVEMLSKEGHPPSYILKPKSANKEVVVISKASTGHLHGGKVLMVSLKIGEHQAACFMGPETVKKYFSV